MRNFHKNLMLEGGWRAGRPPDLPPNGRRRYRSGICRLLQGADRRGDGMRNFHKNLMLEGAGGADSLQTSPRMGGDGTGAESSDFCRARTGGGRNAELPQEFDARGGWRAGRPPDLPPNGRRRYRSGIFRLLQDADRRGGGMRNFHKNLMLEGGWRAGRPPDLLAREKTKPD